VSLDAYLYSKLFVFITILQFLNTFLEFIECIKLLDHCLCCVGGMLMFHLG
jgi:uncharacterized membrane protein